MKLHRPSPSMVVALLALVVALGGTSYAAIKLPRNSVGTKQLKNNAVTGAKVDDGSLFANDFASGQLPRGPQGASGPPGPVGPAGPTGESGVAPSPEPWKPLPMSSDWTDYGSIWIGGAFRKDQLGRVWLRGLVRRSTGAPATGSVIATLPVGYRPAGAMVFVVHMGEPNGVGRVDVHPSGTVIWASGPSNVANYTSLNSISFWTD